MQRRGASDTSLQGACGAERGGGHCLYDAFQCGMGRAPPGLAEQSDHRVGSGRMPSAWPTPRGRDPRGDGRTRWHPDGVRALRVGFLRMFHMCWALSEGLSKPIPIDEQPNHQIVHLFRLGKAKSATHEPLNPGPKIDVLALDFLGVFLPHVMLLGIEMPLVGSPAVRVKL